MTLNLQTQSFSLGDHRSNVLDHRPMVPSEGFILSHLDELFTLLLVVVVVARLDVWTLASEDLTQNREGTPLSENHFSLLLWLFGFFRLW